VLPVSRLKDFAYAAFVELMKTPVMTEHCVDHVRYSNGSTTGAML
jgi:hypothetical protein